MGKTQKGVLKLNVNRKDVVFYLLDAREMTFESLYDFIFRYQNPSSTSIYMTKKEAVVVFNYILTIDPESVKLTKIQRKKVIGFSYTGEKSCFDKTFYCMDFKLGTNDFNKIEDALPFIEAAPSRWNQGYTSILRSQIEISERFCEDTLGEYEPSLCPMLFAKTHIEYSNVKCFDATSFYPYLLTQELPHNEGLIRKEDMNLNDSTRTYYGGLLIKKIKAKRPFYPLSLVGQEGKDEIKDGQGKNIERAGRRLIAADEVILYGFIPFLLNALKEYDYEECQISKTVITFRLRTEKKLREFLLEKFEDKQSKKRAKENYTAEKILLNRIYGFFITKGNRTAPPYFGQYIVQKGKNILLEIIRQIGLKDVIHSHTDSIKFIGSHEDVIEAYNKTIEFEELGKFAYEGTMERVVYYNINKAKYIMDGELRFKHGGIAKEDIAPLAKLDYDQINENTEYELTVSWNYDDIKGFYGKTTKTKFGDKVKEVMK